MNSKCQKAFFFATEVEARTVVNEFGFECIAERPFKIFKNGSGNLLFISRIGLLNAANCFWFASENFGFECAYNIGACGALKSGFKLGDFVSVNKNLFAFDYAKKIYFSSVAPDKILQKLPCASLITSLNPVTENSHRAILSEQADLVDMEAYALCKVADLKKIPFYQLKFVSDFSADCDIEKNVELLENRLLTFGEIF